MFSDSDIGNNLKYFALALALFVGGNWMLDSVLMGNVKSGLASYRQEEIREMLALGHVEMGHLKALRTLQAARDLREDSQIYPFSPFAVPEMGPWKMLKELTKPRLKERVEIIINTHGFFSIEDWVRHWYSLLMSAAYYDSQMQSLEQEASDDGKQRVTLPRPPEKNLRAVALLLQNEELGKWLHGMMEKLGRLR